VVHKVLSLWWLGLLLSSVVLVMVPQYSSIVDLKINKAFIDLDAFRAALILYKNRYQHYPSSADGLGILAPEFTQRISRDPWGSAYEYRSAGPDSYVVYSAGADGLDQGGAGDDITTPKKKYNRATYGMANPTDAPHLIGYAAFALLLASAGIGLARGAMSVYRSFTRGRKVLR
jgi:hypothetical protein